MVGYFWRYGEVLTPFVGDKKVTDQDCEKTDDVKIHDDCIKRLRQCHAVVAEVSVPSLGVGYEIGRAVAMGKNVLCLYRPEENGKLLSAMIRGMENDSGLRVFDYNIDEVDGILNDFLS